MVVTVALALVNKLGGIPRQEGQSVDRVHILRIFLCVEHALPHPCHYIVCHELRLVLAARQFYHVQCLLIGSPGDVREIAVGRVTRL